MNATVLHGLSKSDTSKDLWNYKWTAQRVFQAPLAQRRYCLACEDWHPMECLIADVEWDSTPCTPWSSSNNQRSRMDCPSNLVWMCNTQRHRQQRTKALHLENVAAQPSWFVEKDYDEDRLLFRKQCEPADVGFGYAARKRALTFLPHKDRCRVTRDPMALFDCVCRVLRARDLTRPGLLLDVGDLEFLVEAQQLHRRRFRQDLPMHIVAAVTSGGADAVDFTWMLLPRELQSLMDFVERYSLITGGLDAFKNPELLVFLGDNASTHLSWSATSGKIPTARTNTGIMWSPHRKRWLTSRKMLSSMGIPQTQRHLEALGLSAEDVRYLQLEHMSCSTRRHWAGNCVHAAVAGVFVGCTLASIQFTGQA